MSPRPSRSRKDSSRDDSAASKSSKLNKISLADFDDDELKKIVALYSKQKKTGAAEKKKQKQANEKAATEQSERAWQRRQQNRTRSVAESGQDDDEASNATDPEEHAGEDSTPKRTPKRVRHEATDDEESDTSAQVLARKKAKGPAVEIIVGTAEPLKKTKKAARKDKLANTEAMPMQVDSESQKAAVTGPFTPYSQKLNPNAANKPRAEDFSPTSRRLVASTKSAFQAYLATQNAFPSEDVAFAKADDLFTAATQAAESGTKSERREQRFEIDEMYKKDVRNAIKNSMSSFRGHVVEAAEPLVVTIYNMKKKKEKKEERAKRVQNLLNSGLFAFEDTEKREGFLGNEIIPELFSKSFLTKTTTHKHGLGFGAQVAAFRAVPNHLLAFLLTAIHCALKHWSTGSYKEEKFDSSIYDDIYDAHLDTIEYMENEDTEYMKDLRKDIWEEACELAGIQPTIIVHDDAADNIGYLAKDDVNKLTRRTRRNAE